MSRAPILLSLLLCSGCHSFLQPFDERPLPAPLPRPTEGGGALDLGDRGELVLRPAPGDIEAALGVGLADDPDGVLVTNRLRPETLLHPGDRIVAVSTAVPDVTPAIRQAFGSVLEALTTPHPERAVPLEQFDPTQFARVRPSGARARPETAVPIATVDDLRPYLVGLGWLHLDIQVLRDDTPQIVRQPLYDTSEWVPTNPWRPETTRWHGVDLVAVERWPDERRPVDTSPGDLLVTRVARDSPAGQAGLRPLDVVSADKVPALLDGMAVEVLAADGSPKSVRLEPREPPTELWFPLLFSYQSDGVRSHLGLGPLELLFHRSSRVDYAPTLDGYIETWRWAFLTNIQGTGVRSPAGSSWFTGFVFLETSRLNYLFEWWEARTESEARRRPWSLRPEEEDEDEDNPEGDPEGAELDPEAPQ